MTQGKKLVVVGFAVLAMGGLRMPFERALSRELDESGLAPKKLEVGTGEKIGQTFFAVSLGGLRTLVATVLNLRAFTFFTEQKWARVGETFDLIVDMAPRTRYYWDCGSWHQSYNAASYYLYESSLPSLRRRVGWRDSILAGRDFLERGIRNNPDDTVLRERLGYLLADPNKITAFGEPAAVYEESYKAFMQAVETGYGRSYAKRAALYSLARIPGREKEALDLAEEINAEQKNLPPTMLCVIYMLRYHDDPEQGVMELADSIFPNRATAYHHLGNYWLRTRDRFPVFGVAKALKQLEIELKITEEQSVFKKELLSPMDVDKFFTDEPR